MILFALAVLMFLSTTAYKTDYFEIAKQIEIFTTIYKEINMSYVDKTKYIIRMYLTPFVP